MVSMGKKVAIPVPEVVDNEYGWILWDLFNENPAEPERIPAIEDLGFPDTEVMVYEC